LLLWEEGFQVKQICPATAHILNNELHQRLLGVVPKKVYEWKTARGVTDNLDAAWIFSLKGIEVGMHKPQHSLNRFQRDAAPSTVIWEPDLSHVLAFVQVSARQQQQRHLLVARLRMHSRVYQLSLHRHGEITFVEDISAFLLSANAAP
jgi:hypothetical protein